MPGNYASHDDNFVPTLIGVSSDDLTTPTTVAVDPTTHKVLVDGNFTIQVDVFTATNLQTDFTPSQTPSSTIFLSANGQVLTPTTDYSLTGGDYVLVSGVPAGTIIVACYTY